MAIITYKRQKGKPLGKDEKEYNHILRERYRDKRRGYRGGRHTH